MTVSRPTHTPYSGTSTPFTIGLRPLDLRHWLETDDSYAGDLAQKDRLIEDVPGTVLALEPATHDAQAETLSLVANWLRDALADGRIAAAARAAVEDRLAQSTASSGTVLVTAARLVQEDLVLMRRGEGGWRLAAACLCFPSSWSLREKFSRPIADIHETVPGFGPGTRNAGLIDRIFDRLLVDQPVERFNWSIQDDDALHKPKSKFDREHPSLSASRLRFPDPAAAALARVRVERQTLRRLPASGDILFTIRIHLDPLAALARRPDRAELASSFADQVEALTQEQAAYKGIAGDRANLTAAIRGLARG